MKTTDLLDYSAGALLYPKIGDQVNAGDTIGILHCNDEIQGREVLRMIQDAYSISEAVKEKEELIYEIL
jgi:pyrimidine-nucleoside phosphorylase